MKHLRLGGSGLRTSRLWLGGMSFGNPGGRPWVLDEPASTRLITAALERGINTIDTCDVYSGGRSEEIIGRVVKNLGNRDRLILCTKFGWPMTPDADVNARGYSRKYIVQAVENSLRRLQTDYIDLYQTHIWDPETVIDEMVDALDRLVQAGKVRYLGAADMPARHLAKAIFTARYGGRNSFISMQYHYNAVWREAERELMPLCREEGIGLAAYSPVARGFLCGPDRRTARTEADDRITAWYGRAADRQVGEAVTRLAEKLNVSPACVALGWVFSKPGLAAAVVGPTRVEQLDDLCSACERQLAPEDVAALDSLYAVRPAAGHP